MASNIDRGFDTFHFPLKVHHLILGHCAYAADDRQGLIVSPSISTLQEIHIYHDLGPVWKSVEVIQTGQFDTYAVKSH